MRNIGVICAGSIVHDTVVRPVDSPQWGTTTLVQSITQHLGGNGANTAAALAKLGCRVKLLGAIGDDDAARTVSTALTAAGVDISALNRTSKPNAATIVLVHTDGRRQFLHRHGSSEDALTQPIVFTSDLAADAQHFHLASLFVLPHLRDNAPAILSAAKQAGLSTSLDTNWDPQGEWLKVLSPCLPLADVLFLNEEESSMLTGADDPISASQMLHDLGASVVVQKRGKDGSIVCCRGEHPIHVPGYSVVAVDSTGAGDCFAAGFLRSWLQGDTLAAAAKFGNAAGAQSVTATGAIDGLLTEKDFMQWMDERM